MDWRHGVAVGALVAATGLASAKEPGAVCGAPGKPPCPLQHWMRVHAAAPLAGGELDELERSFQTLVELNPDPAKWGNWTKIAKEGAQAARDRRESGVRTTCGRCHRAYRRAYNARYRLRAIGAD